MDARLFRPNFMQRKLDEDIEKEFAVCLWDGQPLTKGLDWYCSGSCINEVRKRGLYGKEEAIKLQLEVR
jgi:hypothetical protein